MNTFPSGDKCTKREKSLRDWRKPIESMKVDRQANQALGACLRPYNERFNLQTWVGWDESVKPRGYVTVSLRKPCKNTLFTSSCLITKTWETEMYSGWFDNQIEDFIIVEAKTMMKAFGNKTGFITFDSLVSFLLDSDTHLQPITFVIGLNETRVQMLLVRNAWYSVCMALRQSSWRTASLKVDGSTRVRETTGFFRGQVACAGCE